jgi:positive regulator of sigma E activity
MYRFEWIPGLSLVAAVLVFPLAPAFAMIALILAALVAVVALVALAAAVIASPYLLVRSVHRHLAERHVAEPRVPERPQVAASTFAIG